MKYHQDLTLSAIREWLDEELKARGIDNLEYSQYLVSLLHPGTVHGPEQELQFRQREVMESLVEQLCVKLQEANGDVLFPLSPSVPSDLGGLSSPEEPAESDYGSLDPDDLPTTRRIEDFLKPLERAPDDDEPSEPARDPPPRRAESPQRRADDFSLPQRRADDFSLPPRRADDFSLPPRRADDFSLPQKRASDVSMPRGPSRGLPQRRAGDYSVPWGRAENRPMPRGPAEDSPDDLSMPHWRADDFSRPRGRVEDFSVPWGRTVDFARNGGRDLPQGRADYYSMPQGRADYYSMPQGRADNFSMQQGRADFSMPQGWSYCFPVPSWMKNINPRRVSKFSTAWRPVDESSMPRELAEGGGNPKKRRENKENDGLNNRYYSLFNNDYTTNTLGEMRSGNARGGSLYQSSSSDQCMADNRYDSAQDTDLNMYDDMPRGINDLLDGPPRPQRNLFTSMYDDGKREYIPYGASITRSIWSNDRSVARDNDSNWATNGPDLSLGYQFSSISIDTQAKPLASWPPVMNSCAPVDNDRNPFLENNQNGFRSLPNQWDGPIDWDRPVVWERPIAATNERKRTVANFVQNCDALSMCWECSMRQVHHDRRRSGFAEFYPRPLPEGPPSNPPVRNCSQSSAAAASEDLLESDSTHFKPIVQDKDACEEYEDGTTFTESKGLLKVAFRRSDSGSLWLGNQKYHALENKVFTWPPDERYVVKFHVCRTDEACQTDETDEQFVDDDNEEPTDVILYPSAESPPLTASSPSPNAYPDEFAPSRSDSGPSRSESNPIGREYDPISPGYQSPYMWYYDEIICERCYADKIRRGRARCLSDIWRGGEVCQACLYVRGELCRPAPSLRLLQDISRDGEKLLSDLDYVQKAFKVYDDDDLPPEVDDATSDIYELLVATRERKRRYSVMLQYEDDSREKNVRIQISTAKLHRSLTM